MSETPCPTCQSIGLFVRHGRYWKYFFATQIEILRVRCRGCLVTHALMPAFSLPGTSIGTVEAEAYLDERERGVGRGTAAKPLLELGVSLRYPKQLERMFATAVSRAKALFPDAADERLSAMAWVHTVIVSTERPLWSLNRYSLSRGYNCICFCRASILTFAPRSAGSLSSHNHGSPARPPPRLRS